MTIPTSPQTIAIASDHGGFELKERLKQDLSDWGFMVLDLGTDSTLSVDYPDYAEAMAAAIRAKVVPFGILICGTGIGISIAVNRHPEVRAALVHNEMTARLAREHNDANVIALGGRVLSAELARDCVRVFLDTAFEGGRHARRVAKMSIALDAPESLPRFWKD